MADLPKSSSPFLILLVALSLPVGHAEAQSLTTRELNARAAAQAAAANSAIPPVSPGLAPQVPTDPVEALSRYLRVLAASPRDLDALTGAGNAALAIGDANAAVSLFARAEEVSPRNGRIKAGLAAGLVQLDQPRTAIKLFDDAVALGVPEAEIAGDRGLAYDLRGDTKRAQADYADALRWRPDDEVTRRLAVSQAIGGNKAAALTTLEPLLRRQDRAAWRVHAFVLALSGDRAGAEAAAIAVMPRTQAEALIPFFGRLAVLGPGQKAAAVHLGQFPADGRTQTTGQSVFAAALPPSPGTTVVRPADPKLPSSGTVSAASPLAGPANAPGYAPVAASARSAAASVATAAVPRPVVEAVRPPRAPAGADAPSPSIALSAASPAISPPLPGGAEGTLSATPAPRGSTTYPIADLQLPVAPAAGQAAGSAVSGAPLPVMDRRPSSGPFPGVAPGFTVDPLVTEASPAPPARDLTPVTAPGATVSSARSQSTAPIRAVDLPASGIAQAPANPTVGNMVARSDRAVPPIRRAAPNATGSGRSDRAEASGSDPIETGANGARRKVALAKVGRVTTTDAKATAGDEELPVAARRQAAAGGRGAGSAKAGGERPTDKAAHEAGKQGVAAEKPDKSTRKDKNGKTDKADNGKNDKTEKGSKAGKEAPSTGEQYWVQVASGANRADLGKAWARTQDKAPKLLRGRTTWTTPWKQSNRLLVGPFKSEEEAQGLVNSLGKAGLGGIQFTTRGKGKVEKLGGE